MAENFIPYMRQSDQGLWSCLVDVQHRSLAGKGDAAKTLLTIAHVTAREPGEQGLVDPPECQRIDGLFDHAAQRLAAAGGVFVARTRGRGHLDFMVYSNERARDPVASALRNAFPGENLDLETRADPRWEVYRDMLPTREEERSVLDAQVVMRLEEHGDPLTVKRDVRHYAYFAKREAAEAFAAHARKQDFRVELEPSAADPNQHCVIASRDDAVNLESITPITASLAERAEALGGEYDGWEAALVKPQKRGLMSRLLGRGT